MNEIVIIRSYLYRKGEGVYLDRLLADDKEVTNKWGKCRNLWWFDCTDEMTLEKAAMRTMNGEATMLYDAIRFRFEPVANPRADHFDFSVLHSEYDFNGGEIFESFLPQLVAIVKEHLADEKFLFDCNFYGLFEVETDEYRDCDGGLDSISVYVIFQGELDMDNLLVTTESKNRHEASRDADGDLPYYSDR